MNLQNESLSPKGAQMPLNPVHSTSPGRAHEGKDQESDALRLAQRLLNQVASLNLPLTGEADGHTTKALRWYQRTRGLRTSGTLDAATLRALRHESGPKCSNSPHLAPTSPKDGPKTTHDGSKTPSDLPLPSQHSTKLWESKASLMEKVAPARMPPTQEPEAGVTLMERASGIRDRYAIPRPLGDGPDGW